MSDGRGRRSVLVVEDDVASRALLLRVLGDAGYDVRAVSDGCQALDVIERWRPDVILLDLSMPSMDGQSFSAECRARGLADDVPVVVVSAHSDLREPAEQIGAVAFIQKPFDVVVLLTELSLAVACREWLTP